MINRVKDILTSRLMLLILRWLLAIVFIHSGLGKITDNIVFATDVANYRILPLYMINVFAIILPWVEILCGLSLINGINVRSSAFLIALMNLMFIAAASLALARGLDIECGCKTLAARSTKVGAELIIRDAVFLLICLPIIFHSEEHRRLGKY